MKQYILQTLFLILISNFVNAQPYAELTELKNHSVKIFYSPGQKQRAQTIAKRIDNAMEYYQQTLDFKPIVTLLILKAEDWKKYSGKNMVYGMPHYKNDATLIVAAEDNDFWRSFLPPLDMLPISLQTQIQKIYKTPEGTLSMQAFFDLLALHELGHAFHFQDRLNMQRKWMGELFTNILLHTYIAENEPEFLPALTLFPQMVIENGAKEFTYTSLRDIENLYNEIGEKHPKNYGWYQSRWHSAAAKIYDIEGKKLIRKLWDALKSKKENLYDEDLIHYLEATGAASVADVMRNWDRDTKK